MKRKETELYRKKIERTTQNTCDQSSKIKKVEKGDKKPQFNVITGM
jgi:hypothetical protein